MTEQPITILLLEDNPGDQELMREMVEMYGGGDFQIESFDSLNGAVERLNKDGIDIIVSDMWLPDSDGLDTFLALHARAPGLPVVILSGNEDERTAIAAVQSGAQDYFVKGQIDGPVFIRALRYAMERARMVSERESLQQQLFHSQKMESLGQLAGGIAHDFNNILTTILGNTHMCAMQCDPGTPLRDMLDVIRTAGEKASELTQKLQSFSRADRVELKPMPINMIARELCDMLQRTTLKKINFHQNLCDDTVFANMEYNQLFQAALNICNNAADAMPDGGDMGIETRVFRVDKKPRADGGAIPPGDYALLAVSDTGPGIPDDVMPRIFEPFFTTKGKGIGAGLGLTVTRNIIDKLNGFIRIETQRGKGTTVSIILPMAAAVNTSAAAPAAASNGLAHGSGTVLLVDDEDFVRDITAKILTSAGYTVLSAASGAEAVDIYRKRMNDISAVVLDMVMPEMNGREVFQHIKQMNPGARALVVSGYAEEGQVRAILDEGLSDYVAKPYNAHALTSALKKLIEG